MVDSAIITIQDNVGEVIGDFELPIKIPIKELSVKLVGIMKAMDSERFAGVEKFQVEYENKQLDDEDTLYAHGIWDGSVIRFTV